ncbi:SDR family NAD(P)-dependent oxidoreductase [Streptomyces asiaticus]
MHEHSQESIFRFLVDGEGEPQALGNAELDLRARTIAAVLQERFPAKERALIMCPAGLDYVISFFACLYADIVAVPVYPPDPAFPMRTLPRLTAIVEDAEPAVVLAPAATVALVDRFAEHAPGLRDIVWMAVDDIDTAAAHSWREPGTGREDLAFLQYTSGSTSSPKGVMVSHGNLMHNISEMNRRFFAGDPRQHMVSWLPPFHDLGLIMGLLTPAHGGYPVTFMSPYSFLKRPLRWLRAISDAGATASPAPNFAYDLAVAKVTEEDRRTLDLSTWRVALNGAEPVRKQTMERFSRTFAECGFRPTTHAPSYGLAEATLVVSTGDPAAEPVHRDLRAPALLMGTAEDAAPGEAVRNLPSCGVSLHHQRVVVVDPQTRAALPDGRVGEIWVSGPSVAHGYWRRPEATEETFRARLETGEGTFLRTGDLGFADGGQIYVTGRIKDVVIVAGRNHYPQDIERTVESVGAGLRQGCGVAGAREIDGEERLILVQEYRGSRSPEDRARVIDAIRTEVAREHGLQPYIVALARTGTVPKTSSGKLQRQACINDLLEGTFEPLALWRADEAGSGPAAQGAPAAPDTDTAAPDAAVPDAGVIQQWLREALAAATGRPADTIDPELPFAGYGLRSVEMVAMVGDLERRLGIPVEAGIVWEHPTAAKLARHLAGQPAAPEAPAGADEPATTLTAPAPLVAPAADTTDVPGADEPIAVIGIGCRFPGGVDGPDSFWQLLSEGRDAVTEVPAERWSTEEFTDEDPSAPGRTNSRWGGFLEEIDRFDAGFFGISQAEAARMDPQQRLLAEVSFEALENAGVPTGSLSGTQTGVFVGISTFDYATGQLGDLDTIDAYTGTGSALSIAANRISYLLDLRGPSMAVDSACSSSLVAVVQACASLTRGECDLALVGGVNLVLSPAFAINFSKAGVMSADGRCKPFDASANGYVRSEGAGVVVLKPLSRALADGDPVHAVIRGGAVGQDGASNGLMAPNPKAQEAVVRAAHARAGVRAADIAYVEAHGTGTILGDPVEAKALGAVLGDGRAPDRPCLIGSVKSNLGHMEAAAGIGGLIKTALMVRHRTVPPTLHYHSPNPHIPFADLPVRVADTLQPWPTDAPALAGVSSFGFGGTNAHLVVEEPPRAAGRAGATSDGAVLLTVSARDEQALRDLAARYADKLTDTTPVGAFASAAAVRRTHHEHRLACVGSSPAELRGALAAFGRGEGATGLSCGVRRAGRQDKPVFVFSGQGPRWWPLAADLLTGDLAGEGVFRAVLERADALLRRHTDWSLLDQFAADPARSRLLDTAVGQPALTAVQIALAALWRSWGVEPAAVVGHSVGEIAAAQVAGAVSLEDALLIALHRGTVLHAATGRGRMAVAGVCLDRARALLAERGPGPVWIAAANSPNSTVFSGEGPAVEKFAKSLADDGLYCKVLESVEFASHCPLMEPVAAELRRQLAALRPRPTAIPMISTGTGEIVPGDRLDAEYWASNLTRPVLFDTAITALADTGHTVFVEVSPHPMLTDAVTERVSSCDDAVAVSSLRRDQPGRATVLAELGRLYTAGHPVDFTRVHGPAGPMADLPAYPWQRTRSWYERRPGRRAAHRGHPVLRGRTVSALPPQAVHWSAPVGLAEFPYLADHQVGGSPVLPAALVLDAALAAARAHLGGGAALDDAALTRLTVVPEQAEDSTLQLVLLPGTADTGTVRLFTRAGAGEEWTEAARAGFRRAAPGAAAEPLAAVRARCTTTAAAEDHYAALRRAGLAYGPAFQGVEELWRGRAEAVARLRARTALTTDRGEHPVHPAVLDSALQVLSAALDAQETPLDATYLPVAVGGFTLFTDHAEPRWAHAAVTARPGAEQITGATVVLYDDAGTAVGEVTGITLRRLERAEAADPLGGTLLDIVWRPAPAGSPATGRQPGTWLLFADTGTTATDLATALRSRGATCLTVTAGPAYRKADAEAYELDPRRREDLVALLADLAGAGIRPDGIVHAWALDAGPGEDGDTCLPVLHLVQELARAGQDPAPRLVLVTRGAQRAADGDELAVGQAPLWGLARVIGLEHTELRTTVVDLDPARPAAEGTQLLDEVLRPGGEDQVALRGQARLTPALQRWAPAGRLAEDRRPAWSFDAARDGNHRLLAARPGTLSSLRPAWWHRTPPGPGQVEIEVTAAGLNFSDVLKALDSYPGAEGVVPLGAECAGRISAVGEGVSGRRVGDRVIAAGPGGMAAFITLDERLAAPAPAALDDEQAAAVPIAFLTAVYGLEHLGRLRAGDSVLIHSATGGVGLAALQVARRRGARVFATAGTPAKREMLRGLGVEHVMDSRTLDFAAEITALTGGRGVDVVLNSASGETLVRSLGLLAPGGRFVEIGKRDIYDNSHIGLEFFKDNRAFLAVDLERTIREEPGEIAALLADVVQGFERGDFTALPVTVHPFGDAPAAFTAMAKARHTGKLVLVPTAGETVTTAPGAAPVRPFGTYLITGGLGALGLETARYLTAKGARHLALVGRSAPGPDAEEALASLRTRAEVTVFAADVSERAAVEDLLTRVERCLPPLAGIVHAAGVLDDGLLTGLDRERFRAVAGPKSAAAWHLHQATVERELDFFVLYSSAAAVLGSASQGNYAAASAFLDTLAHHRRSLDLPALSIDWGPWSRIGLAARPERGGALAARGIESIGPEQGIAALDRILRGDATQVCVLPLDRERLRDHHGGGLLRTLLEESGEDARGAAGAREEVRRQMLAVEPGRRRRAVLTEHCRAVAARVVGAEPARIDTGAPLTSMGFDSLLSLELRKSLESSLGVQLPSTVTWRFPTIDALVPYLADRMEVELEPGQVPGEERPDAPAAPLGRSAAVPARTALGGAGPLATDGPPDLEALSAAELEALLMAKTTQIDEGDRR